MVLLHRRGSLHSQLGLGGRHQSRLGRIPLLAAVVAAVVEPDFLALASGAMVVPPGAGAEAVLELWLVGLHSERQEGCWVALAV